MSLPARITDKIGKLIPRLASDHDGEIVSTVRAIRRTLESAGSDLHDLAARLSGSTRSRLGRAANADDPDTWGWSEPPWSELPPTERLRAVEAMLAMADKFSAWEISFLLNIRNRLRSNPWARVSEKQTRILNGLLASAREE
jgi:hypothetical protein